MDTAEAIETCQSFANKHKLIFETEGECWFGRECVGFLSRGGNWLAFNPRSDEDFKLIDGLHNDDLYAPDGVIAYHKHDCMAVLGRGDGAIMQLAEWVNKINSLGNVRVESFQTGDTGIQAIISGLTGYCIMAGDS